ncbi:MAG: hypothetical protein JXX28_00195 [Deltaproteobacteria bacterium]|nr:hypothetical protein [Deltaproteobacteria bacterium]
MRHLGWWTVILGLAACEPMPSSGDPLAPVIDHRAPASTAPVLEQDPELAAIFDERGADDGAAGELSPERLAAALGGGLAAPPETATPPVPPAGASPAPIPDLAPAVSPAPPPPPPIMGAFPTSWGVRLVSTVSEAQPPRAILGLPDGSEQVVQAGDLIPAVGVVVLAIGRDQVQLAEIRPQGDHATVEARMLSSLFPSAR